MNTIKLKGIHNFKIVRKNGEVESWTVENMITNTGLALITSRLGQSSEAIANYIAVGTSNTAVGATQTGLGGEITDSGLQRATGTFSQQTTTTTNDTFQITKTWTASGTKTIEEVGVFNESSSGTMLSRVLTNTRTVYAGDTFTDTYKLIITRA